jgi:hypothetical protein
MSSLENLLIVFIVVTALAVVLQTGVLLALYLAVRKTSARMQTLGEQMESRILPAMELAQDLRNMLQAYRPKLDTLAGNLADSSDAIKRQIVQLDAGLTDLLERGRLQVARADEVLARTLTRVDDTAELVHRTVIAPIRQVGGVLQGVSAGVVAFFHRNRANVPLGNSKDKDFI